MARRGSKTAGIYDQIKYVIEGQGMDANTMCELLGVDVFDVLDALPVATVLSNAAQFGVNPNDVADELDEDSESDEMDDEL